MSLEPGTRLGPYEVLALIGAGGMGEVYKARDTRLDRIVAVKVSKDEFSERFSREARNVAALNHPNICTLHDVGPNYLVMEFVEGETLSGPLPIDTCIHYGRQIIEAIEAAHDKAIIHRDLKPANIKVTPEGTIKVLDFGLAKALDSDVSSAPGPDSPTLSMTMTRAGMILGTAAYMSPEQAKGKQADRRADIWAFGVVLYEMLTGKQAFTGETAAETLASVMMAQLPLDRLPDTTPPALRQVITRCLERDVRRRLQAIGEARIILESSPTQTEVPTKASTRRTWIPWTIAAVLLVALVAAMGWILKPAASPIVTRFPIALGEGQQYSVGTNRLLVAISSDGTQIVYAANSKLYLRSMPDLVARLIPGSESVGGLVASPAFSPDGKSLVFYAASEQALKRVAVSGGAAVTLCPTGGAPFGVSWTNEGILYARGKEILRVSENGGKPEVLITANEGERITQPQMLPGGKAVLYTVGRDSGTNSDWDKAQVVVQELKSGPRKLLVDGGSDGRYLPTGHLVYALSGVLFAQSFDLGRMALRGSPVSILEGVTRSTSGNANFSVSDTGTLVYVPGPAAAGSQGSLLLARVDLQGNVEPLKAPPSTYFFPRVSPDGKRVAYGIDDGKEANIGIYDVAGTKAPRLITFGGVNRDPIWASNERVAFQSEREGDVGIWWTRADGTGTAERLTKPEKGAVHTPESWSPDGEHFLFTINANNTASLYVFSMKDKKATLFAEIPQGLAGRAVFSPDGHWVAYQVLEAGETRMYVQPFPPTGAKYRLPQDGNNHHAVWSQPDGATLFFVPGNGRLDSVSFTTRPSPAFGPPTPMPKGSGFNTREPAAVRSYDIFPDGKHFIGVVGVGRVQPEGAQASSQFQVVLNWFQELKQRVPNR